VLGGRREVLQGPRPLVIVGQVLHRDPGATLALAGPQAAGRDQAPPCSRGNQAAR
jgi:hypothetical protein